MKTADFNYPLPPERIAQTPIEPRDSSRLFVYNRKTDRVEHRHFRDIGDYLNPGDLLVRNQTKVLPARIYGKKESGGKVELLLLRKRTDTEWECLIGGKKIREGAKIVLSDNLFALVLTNADSPRRVVRFEGDLNAYLSANGQMPLPPYIHEKLSDQTRYQTVYANPAFTGSAAAPTAGLHFTNELIASLEKSGVEFADVTLHVGLDTFQPVSEDDPAAHTIHKEWCEVDPASAARINRTKASGRCVIAVGTTSARTLETAAQAAIEQGLNEPVAPIRGDTGIFILPGFAFRAVDALITNFHLPKSTLIMMISAFIGREKTIELYELAIREEYRFFSFGDAMLIL